MNALNRTKRFATLGISWTLAMAVAAPAVLASPPEHAMERARQAIVEGRQAAEGLAEVDAEEQPDKAKGLENAARAIEAAAVRRAEHATGESPGNGKALGRGHAADVHDILARGGSPSELPPHGQTVRSLAKAFEKLKADHPGKGEGLTKEKPAGGTDDDSEEIESEDD